MELDEELKQQIIKLIKEGKPLPTSLKALLFPIETKQMEYELIYGIKERKEDILADTMSIPFQVVKQFGKAKERKWKNKLIFGDNLQVLKFMLKNPEIKGKVRLVYIDPPFGTGELYDVAGVPAFSAALKGAEFIEFLRKRLILLRELLADNGSIYVRTDYHFGHYIKVIMDEIFGKNNFKNEIVINRTKAKQPSKNFFTPQTDSLFFYTKTQRYTFNQIKRKITKPKWYTLLHFPREEKTTPWRVIFGKKYFPPKGRRWALSQEKIDEAIRERRVMINDEGTPEILYDTKPVRSEWLDIPGYSQRMHFPTENSEEVLERVIRASSNLGDIVLDCFAGSGTTGAVAEKLGRKWIMVDSSKLAIYTMIKRMFNLKKEIGNKGKPLKPKPFVLYNAGLYKDHEYILKIGERQYKKFAMNLFQVEPKEHEINGLQMNGILFNCPVKVFSQKGFLTEEYIDELHETIGEFIKGRMFIIAPASRVYFLQDYIERKGIRYYVLRIPYSIIDELHKKSFTKPLQATSASEINQLIEQVGFDFIHPPKVKAEYYKRKPKDKLIEKVLVIEIKKFEAVQRAKKPREFEDPQNALSMVLVDTNYNDEYFNMTHYFFKDQIEKEGWKIRIPAMKVGKKIMIIYLDIFGNEQVEVKKLEDFKKR